MCSYLVMPFRVTKAIRWIQLEKDNKGWTKAERANRWVIIPSFIIRAYEELLSRIQFSDEQSLGQPYAVKIMRVFLFICLYALRDFEMLFVFIIVENICRIKRGPLIFVVIYRVMLGSGSSIQPDPLS